MQIHFSFLTKEGWRDGVSMHNMSLNVLLGVSSHWTMRPLDKGRLAQPKPITRLYKHFLQNFEADDALKT